MKQLAIITITSALAATIHAANVPDSFLSSLDLGPKVDMTQTDAIRACTDFTGSWKGTCTVGEKTKEENFTVKQKGCEFIEVSDSKGNSKMTLPIGGTFNGGGVMPGNPAVTFGGNIQSHWNKEHTVLNLLVGGGAKQIAIDTEPHGFMVKEEMKVDGNKLAVTIVAHHSKGKTNGTCEFIKQ